ncbi:MAG: hypothetical protein KDA80_04640 [Planctomycetaceae bacterium]|nr:hypothetical protein [Planctomycetaceae bacterium]
MAPATSSPKPVRRLNPPPPGVSEQLGEATPNWKRPTLPWWRDFWNRLNGDEGAGFAMSFVVHLVLLGLMTIPVYRTFDEGVTYTTVVQQNDEENVQLDGPLDTLVDMPQPSSGAAADLQSRILDLDSARTDYIPDLKIADTTSADGDGGREGSGDDGLSGLRTAAPENAIHKGSFSVWPWPIVGNLLRGGVLHAEPGASPKVRQNYHIVIRIRVPEGTRSVSLRDFSGSVEGTDSYHQKIPEDAFYYNTRGQLVRASIERRIPVIDGTAELLIRVPGASLPSIRDTIVVKSDLLGEEQKIELQFEARD